MREKVPKKLCLRNLTSTIWCKMRRSTYYSELSVPLDLKRSNGDNRIFYRNRFPRGTKFSSPVNRFSKTTTSGLEGESSAESASISEGEESQSLMQHKESITLPSGMPSEMAVSGGGDGYDYDEEDTNSSRNIQIEVPSHHHPLALRPSSSSSRRSSHQKGRTGRRFTLNPLIFAKVGHYFSPQVLITLNSKEERDARRQSLAQLKLSYYPKNATRALFVDFRKK